jgi:hypothetical protein
VQITFPELANRVKHSKNIGSHGRKPSKSRYNNGFIAKLVRIFADVEERGEEREESLALMQATSWARHHRHMWAQTKMYVRRNMKEKVRHGIT